MSNLNPLEIKITDITIEKFSGADKMSLLPQFVEVSIFQSIFEPSIKAEMLLNDQIGLFVNYPFTGEEVITVLYTQVSSSDDFRSNDKKIKFIIRGVRNIITGDRARSLMYIVDLISPFYLQNARKYVSQSYKMEIEKAAQSVYDEYIAADTTSKFNVIKSFITEPTIKVRSLIVPNLRPFNGIQWLAKHAVAQDPDHYTYLFFEDSLQFNFVTAQKLIQDAWAVRSDIRDKKYKFISDNEISNKSPTGDPDQDLRLITNIVVNKRFSSMDKIFGGYYQNELIEISMLQKSYNSTPTELDANKVAKYALEPHPLNTPEYISYVKNANTNQSAEYSNRIRYIINNYEDFSNEDRSQPSYRVKFGPSTKYLYAVNQIDLSITVPANMTLRAGQIIWCDIPENHGFNIVDFDIYLSGFFMISEVKQVLSAGNRAATSLRIYKDGYLSTLLETSEYNTSATKPAVRSGGA